MKIKIRPDDGRALETNGWLEMNDWIAELRDEGRADQVGDSHAEPAGDSHVEPAGDGGAKPETAAVVTPANRFTASAEIIACVEITERAAIGDKLRIPVAWCEMRSCISHHTDPAALGEADIRARAISGGWRVDALGRLACPKCQQSGPDFWASHPVAPWDRHAAIVRASLMAAAIRNDGMPDCPTGGQQA